MTEFINFSKNPSTEPILAALYACYGSLEKPDFRKVSEILRGNPYYKIISFFRSNGVEVRDTTDLNNDVSVRLVLDQSGDQVGLALSGVGPFAAVLHQDSEENYLWVTQSEEAPTPLAAMAARTVEREGFRLLDRSVVSQPVAMNWYDGSTEVTLYQALFSDSDWIP